MFILSLFLRFSWFSHNKLILWFLFFSPPPTNWNFHIFLPYVSMNRKDGYWYVHIHNKMSLWKLRNIKLLGSISYQMTSIINHQTIRLIIQWTSADGSYPKRSIFNWCCLQSPQWMLGVGRQLKTQSKATAQTIISFFPIRLLTSI